MNPPSPRQRSLGVANPYRGSPARRNVLWQVMCHVYLHCIPYCAFSKLRTVHNFSPHHRTAKTTNVRKVFALVLFVISYPFDVRLCYSFFTSSHIIPILPFLVETLPTSTKTLPSFQHSALFLSVSLNTTTSIASV